jgi:Flp pilus assembly protein TadB
MTRLGVAALAGVAAAAVVGGAAGLLAGAVVAIACVRLLATLEPRGVRERRARLVADLPVAVDLLAACLRGGSSWGESVDAVAAALGGPLGARLHWVAAQVRLGADPVATWLTLADESALAGLARAAARAADSGAALAPTLTRLAQDQRRAARAEAGARARAAGVRAVAPLGLCFLPSFVLIGIVPAIVGIATGLPLPR